MKANEAKTKNIESHFLTTSVVCVLILIVNTTVLKVHNCLPLVKSLAETRTLQSFVKQILRKAYFLVSFVFGYKVKNVKL